MSIFRKIRSWWCQESECQPAKKPRRPGYPGKLEDMYEKQQEYVAAFNEFCLEANHNFSYYIDVLTAYRLGRASAKEYEKATKDMQDFIDNRLETHNLFIQAQDFCSIAAKNMVKLKDMFHQLYMEQQKMEDLRHGENANKRRYRKHRT